MAEDEESPFEPLKILVRDLAPNTTQENLHRYFTRFSDVTEAIIPHNTATGSPHSFGFVSFKRPLRIPFILQIPHCIHDRCVEVSRALKGEDLQTLESQRMTSTYDNFQRPESFDIRRIFVQGPPRPGITSDEYLKYFQGFGSVIDGCFLNDIGFGHITFRIKRGADRVLYRRSYVLNGRRLMVNRLKRIPLNDAHNPNGSRAISIREEAAASNSGGDHVNGKKDMRPQAATSDSDSRNILKIIMPTATSGTDHVDGVKDMKPQAAATVCDTKNLQIVPAAANSGIDHVNSNTYMQRRAAESVSNTRGILVAANSGPRNMQIIPAAANYGPTNMQTIPAASNSGPRTMQIIPAAANYCPTNMQTIPAAANSGSRNVLIIPAGPGSMQIIPAGPRNMQIIPAAANYGPTNMQIIPAAANFGHTNMQIIPAGPRNMQIVPAAANYDPRNMQITPAAASSPTGHPWNNSATHRWRNLRNAGQISAPGHSNFPPSDQSILHYRPQMYYMAPGVPDHSSGLHPRFYQAYNRMNIFTNAANNFPHEQNANIPRNDAWYGNFPMAPTDYSNDQDFNYYDDINGYY